MEQKDGTLVYQDYNNGVVVLDEINGLVQISIKSNTLVCVGVLSTNYISSIENQLLIITPATNS